jgi:hypothetical protein
VLEAWSQRLLQDLPKRDSVQLLTAITKRIHRELNMCRASLALRKLPSKR